MNKEKRAIKDRLSKLDLIVSVMNCLIILGLYLFLTVISNITPYLGGVTVNFAFPWVLVCFILNILIQMIFNLRGRVNFGFKIGIFSVLSISDSIFIATIIVIIRVDLSFLEFVVFCIPFVIIPLIAKVLIIMIYYEKLKPLVLENNSQI